MAEGAATQLNSDEENSLEEEESEEEDSDLDAVFARLPRRSNKKRPLKSGETFHEDLKRQSFT